MTISPAESEPADQPRAVPRFTYATGDQPLPGYTIKRGVGRGGFGEVYFAVSDAGKQVALKLIRRNLDVELRGVTQCLNLKHPNLVALYDIRTDQHEDRWVVMEYVTGQSLEEVIDQYPNGMPVELAMQWFTGMAAGVDYLHDHGIVHRDLKPANIFIDEGTVKIGDYGLSKFISCSRRSGQTESVGTVHYMAPEIANGRYGKEIDTYALGIILYEMLTGHVPFEGESVGEVLMKHLTAEPDLSRLDSPFREIVQGAMAKDPETRLKRIGDMIERVPAEHRQDKYPATPHNNGTHEVNSSSEALYPEATFAAAAPRPGNSGNSPEEAPHRSQEPILAAVQDGWRELEQSFYELGLPPIVNRVIVILLVIGAVLSAEFWLPVLFTAGLMYLIYRGVRALIVPPSKASSPPRHLVSTPQTPQADERQSYRERREQRRRQRRPSLRNQLAQQIVAKPVRARFTELLGSMLVCAAVAAIATLLVCLVTPNLHLEVYTWMTLVTILACWGVMILGKLSEGRVEDQAPLRFIQLIVGTTVGVLAWSMADALLVQLPINRSFGISPHESLMSGVLGIRSGIPVVDHFVGEVQVLPLQVHVAYFAFLFVALAWWRQTELTRGSRVSLWRIFWCGLVAWLLHFVWWFPQPMGMLLAVLISFSTQLASFWLPPSQRRLAAEVEA